MAKKNAAPTKSEILASISKETERLDQEESAQSRLVYVAWTSEDESREETGHEGA
jgi:hypothetical protein